jgi:hypothetical protein
MMLKCGDRGRRVGGGAVEDDEVLPFFIGAEEGGWPVVKAKEWPTLMGMKWLTLNWHFTLWIEGGGRGNGREMRCDVQGSASMAG